MNGHGVKGGDFCSGSGENTTRPLTVKNEKTLAGYGWNRTVPSICLTASDEVLGWRPPAFFKRQRGLGIEGGTPHEMRRDSQTAITLRSSPLSYKDSVSQLAITCEGIMWK